MQDNYQNSYLGNSEVSEKIATVVKFEVATD